jgi:DNA polymerase IV
MDSAPRPRRIAHLDMDAFFASVELLKYPELRGQPVVVGGRRAKGVITDGAFARLRSYAGRGVVTTATYEARAFGVRSGLGLMKAAALAPDAILLPADFEAYVKYSRLFKGAVAEIAPIYEDRGIDEIYIDLTDVPGETRALAQRLKAAVNAATGLSCSIGVTPNKLLSKLASEMEKPDGLTVLAMEDVPVRVWPLRANAINGIGPKASVKLESLGILTIGQLAAAEPAFLIQHFGKSYGAWMAEAAQGIDDSPVVTYRECKSVSTETTFERDLHPRTDRQALSKILMDLCERVGRDLARKDCKGKSIGVKLRFEDFKIVTRDVTLDVATADPLVIIEAARTCLKRVVFDRKLRLLGVRVGTLVRPGDEEAFPQPKPSRAAEEASPLFDDLEISG